MLYRKYIIDIIGSQNTLKDIIFNSSYNSFNFEKIQSFTEEHNYMDNYGIITNNPFKFNTYEESLYYLEKYYYNILYPQMPKIVEIYDNIPYPLLVERRLKIEKIIKKNV